MPKDDIDLTLDALDVGADTDGGASKETQHPASDAGQKETAAEDIEKTPAEGDTSADKSEKGKTEEPMIPKSRLDEELGKNQALTRRLKELEAVDGRLAVLAKRFGRNSQAYLDELERFYDEQDRRNPPTADDRIAKLEQRIEEMSEGKRVEVERQKIARELATVHDNPKYAVLTGDWERNQKWILRAMNADLERSADDAAQELVELLSVSTAGYVKRKSEEARRQIESGGGGAPHTGKKEEKFTKIKDLDRMVDNAVKGAKAIQAQGRE